MAAMARRQVIASTRRARSGTGSGELRRSATSASQRLATTASTASTSPGRQRSPTRSQKLTGSVGGDGAGKIGGVFDALGFGGTFWVIFWMGCSQKHRFQD